MKTCISSYSFNRILGKDFGLFDAIYKAKEIGFDGMEFVPFASPDAKSAVEYASDIAQYCKKVGIDVVNYATSGNFTFNTQQEWQAEVQRLKGEVDIAAALGSKLMRHDASHGFPSGYSRVKTFDAALKDIADGCREVTNYAKTKNIQTMIENHGFFCQDSARVLALVSMVNDVNFGLLCDVGNFSCVDEDSGFAVGAVIPVAKHVHVKDMFVRDGCRPNPGKGWFASRGGNHIRCTILGHGDIPLQRCINIIKSSGYSGYLSLEFEGIEDVLQSIEISYENLIKLIKD